MPSQDEEGPDNLLLKRWLVNRILPKHVVGSITHP